MDIREQFRRDLLNYQMLGESQLDEGMAEYVDKKTDEIADKIEGILEKGEDWVIKTIHARKDDFYSLRDNIELAYRDYKSGKITEGNPNYSKEAEENFTNTVWDILKLLGLGTVLATALSLVTFGGAPVMLAKKIFKRFGNERIKKFLSLSFQNEMFMLEFLNMSEDMGYYGASDADSDEYTVGFKGF